jgi:hypothetical protein
MLTQQSAFLSEMLNPFCEIELSGFNPHGGFHSRFLSSIFVSLQVQPLEAECVITLNHISVTRIVIHIPFLCKGSVPYSGLYSQSDPLKP